MFLTRKKLKAQIEALTMERDVLLAERELSKNSGLSKCKSIACKACEHIVYITGEYGEQRIIGCDITVGCENFKKTTRVS